MILVTGGTGFIGSHLVARLVEQGERVRMFGRFEHGMPPHLENLSRGIDAFRGDVRDETALKQAMDSVDVIFHLSGIGSPGSTMDQYRDIVDVNIAGTLEVLKVAVDSSVRRVVFASSASVYGDSPMSPKGEDLPPAPKSPYAISKVAGEQLCHTFHQRYGLETVVLRYFNAYGPGQERAGQKGMVIPNFHGALQRGEQVTLHGGGRQTRDFVYIDDLVSATVRAGHAPAAAGLILNIGSGHPTSIRDVLFLMAEMLGVTPDVLDMPARAGDILESVADISAARRVLGYEPSVAFKDGLQRSLVPMHRAAAVL